MYRGVHVASGSLTEARRASPARRVENGAVLLSASQRRRLAAAERVVVFTGALPVGIQDFAAGAMQWTLRVYAFLAGITDEYPKFSLQVTPAA